jgi:hypothetical protein
MPERDRGMWQLRQSGWHPIRGRLAGGHFEGSHDATPTPSLVLDQFQTSPSSSISSGDTSDSARSSRHLAHQLCRCGAQWRRRLARWKRPRSGSLAASEYPTRSSAAILGRSSTLPRGDQHTLSVGEPGRREKTVGAVESVAGEENEIPGADSLGCKSRASA